ncbi:transposase [Bradyrhizobium hipponense]|uniref:Transposase n=1 Tax=Bradyrhizobium hipponense TaxID=2605638 RepID=A0A5S4YXY8_9BRAD|nr:transposase [Bradyrhizobium hipponense]
MPKTCVRSSLATEIPRRISIVGSIAGCLRSWPSVGLRHLSRVHRKGRACRRPRVLNARLRDELLNETLFTSLAQARAVLASWKDDYNNSRQHSALGNLTPTEYANRSDPGPQRGGDAALCRGLRAPPRCSTRPMGSNVTGTLPIADEARGSDH